MLTRLHLKNFRAFRNQGFKFTKVNIFVGPNNSGKSSAISAINLLAQTFDRAELSGTPLTINGQFDNLGTYIDLVHGNRSNTPLGIELDFADFQLSLEYKYRQQRREIEIVKCELSEGHRPLILYQARKDSFTYKIRNRDIESLLPGVRKRRPSFVGLLPLARLTTLALMNKESQISEETLNVIRATERSLSRARMELRYIFGNFDSLSPFRDKPQRTYLYSGETAQNIGTTGGNLPLILAADASRRGSESRNMAAEISRWFRVSGIADEIKVKSLTPRHFEIAVSDKSGEHNIADVGFGCSQVLPVLAAALQTLEAPAAASARRSPILVVQEPEIHLHPNAQAALGSFFAGLIRDNGQLFIETHSDNFVLRMARHVADGTLAQDDVKIFYVRKREGFSEVNEIRISADGTFAEDWPDGFFPQRQSESLSLARESRKSEQAFLNRQIADGQFQFFYPEERA